MAVTTIEPFELTERAFMDNLLFSSFCDAASRVSNDAMPSGWQNALGKVFVVVLIAVAMRSSIHAYEYVYVAGVGTGVHTDTGQASSIGYEITVRSSWTTGKDHYSSSHQETRTVAA